MAKVPAAVSYKLVSYMRVITVFICIYKKQELKFQAYQLAIKGYYKHQVSRCSFLSVGFLVADLYSRTLLDIKPFPCAQRSEKFLWQKCRQLRNSRDNLTFWRQYLILLRGGFTQIWGVVTHF